jgi:diguanylate cyclase (GGDEF)-like protein/putative nucleotidyltransferase with HDIG domain
MSPLSIRRFCIAATGLSSLLAATFAVRAIADLGSDAVQLFFAEYVFVGAVTVAGLACAARAYIDKPNRTPWALVAGAAASWSVGNVIYYWMARGGAVVPIPSITDALWLGWTVLMGGALVSFARRSPRRASGGNLDALLGGALVASLSAALVVEPILRVADRQDLLAFIVTLAYPATDIAMVSLVAMIMISRGWRVSRALGLLALAVTAQGVADSFYLVQVSAGTFVVGGTVFVGWLVSWVLIGVATVLREPTRQVVRGVTLAERVLPVAMALAALGLLVFEALDEGGSLTVLVCAATLTIALVRMGVVLADNRKLLETSREEAGTDALTGLPNRRSLIADLAAWDGLRIAVTILDLDGFKTYNDRFGHGAGDDLLRRIGGLLSDAVSGRGVAYRMGGDEFAVVLDPATSPAEVAASITEAGEGFTIGASYGTAILPDDAGDVETALHVADARMYERKFGRRDLTTQDGADVLLAVLQEHSGSLADHGDAVAKLSAATARRLGLTDADVETVALAARLHDVGKLAMPAGIVNKPGPLNDAEWSFMRRHTLIGERILRAAASLASVATVVRSSHERWDGGGYPDQLAGQAIPLAARIVFVSDAFAAMTEPRPYRESLTEAAAVAEIHRCAGTQFDPDVVQAFAAGLQDLRQTGASAEHAGMAGAGAL